MIPDNLLTSLKSLPQWVLWKYEERDGRKTKIPYQVSGYKAASDNPRSWTTYDRAVKSLPGYSGLGVMFSNSLCGIDIDHCLDNGNPSDLASEWLASVPTYWEASPSGTGLHALCFGILPEGRRRDSRQGIEMYDALRFFTVTGNHIDGTPLDAVPCQDSLSIMYKWLFGDKLQAVERAAVPVYDIPLPPGDLDTSIIEMLLRDDRYARLWDLDFTEYSGDHSAADLALVGRIMRAVSNNASWADRIVRQWPGLRDKWDERHFGNGETYGQHTLKVAVCDLDNLEEPAAVVERVAYGYGEVRSRLPMRRVAV